MCRRPKLSKEKGQVVLEYALGMLIIAGLGSLLFLFYQGFVQGNLYGSAGELNPGLYLLDEDDKALGLEKAVSLPLP